MRAQLARTYSTGLFAVSSFRGRVRMFLIEDEKHAKQHGQFSSFDEALAQLRRTAKIPWDAAPNSAPCTSWRTCGREYVILELDDSSTP